MISEVTLGGLLYGAAARHPDRTAVVFPGTRQTYAELRERVASWSRLLLALDVAQGEHVGIFMTNEPEYIELLFAIGAIGAVAVPINPRYRASELAFVVDDSDVSVLLVGAPPSSELDLLRRVTEAFPALGSREPGDELALEGAPGLRWVISLADGRRMGAARGGAPADVAGLLEDQHLEERCTRTRIRDAAMIMYTSGTTSRPKGAVLSHEALVRTGATLGRDRYGLAPEDRLWDPLPLFHMAGLLPLIAAVSSGCAFLCMRQVDAAQGLRMIREEKATVAFIAFAQLAMDMIRQPGFEPSDLDSVRIVHTNGVPELLEKVQAAFPCAVQVNPYGCTEVGGMVATSEVTDSALQRATFSGRPYPGLEVRIVDALNRPVAVGTQGEITVRGYSLFEGYYKNPEATASAVDAEGWFHTGDLGEMDAEGRVRYLSRLKDMLKVGGENVAAAEIEYLLCGHPAVRVAAVVGMPDERLLEVPVAFVELMPGATTTEQGLIDYCRAEIASFKVPRAIRFVTEWPMSATKIQKFRLRELLSTDPLQ